MTYHYPAWTGLKPVTEEHSGDLRAIEGTRALLQIRMSQPLKNGQLVLDGGQPIQLSGGGNNTYTATVPMEKDGAYHLAAQVQGQSVRLSEDYFIATDKAQPPQIAIDRPMGDYRASPIEEVTVGVRGSDEFGLKDMHLHYSVNGGPDHDLSLLPKPGAKQAHGSHTIALEGLKLVPGDVISLYATARDGHSQAQNLLAGSEQQLASGRLGSMASEAGRLSGEERRQSAAIDNLARSAQQASSGNGGGSPDLNKMRQLIQQRDQLAAQRQQLSDDLSKLQGNMRETARDIAPQQPQVAKDLRDALNQMDGAQLGMYVQRTADWLRSGINPNSNGTEGQIARGLGKLSDQLRQAQTAMAQAKPGLGQPGAGQPDQNHPGSAAQTDALNQVERLRNELEAMERSQNARGGQSGANGQNGQGNPNGQPGWQQSNGTDALSRGGQPSGGGGNGGTAWGNYDTGGNTPRARGANLPAPPDSSGNPADSESSFSQQMQALRQLRQSLGDDPQAAKEVEDLTRQMQNLDPRRFPGNPAMVEQMHRELLGSVDRLELELQNRNAQTDARTGKPDAVPGGYQDAVAEYYRRLSARQLSSATK